MCVNANMQAAAAAGSPALAALMRAAPRGQRERASEAAKRLLGCFLNPFKLSHGLRSSPSAAPLVEKLWQRVFERPEALAATVEAFGVCQGTLEFGFYAEIKLIAGAVKEQF